MLKGRHRRAVPKRIYTHTHLVAGPLQVGLWRPGVSERLNYDLNFLQILGANRNSANRFQVFLHAPPHWRCTDSLTSEDRRSGAPAALARRPCLRFGTVLPIERFSADDHFFGVATFGMSLTCLLRGVHGGWHVICDARDKALLVVFSQGGRTDNGKASFRTSPSFRCWTLGLARRHQAFLLCIKFFLGFPPSCQVCVCVSLSVRVRPQGHVMRARVHTVWRCASRWGGEGSQEGADAPATRLCAGWQDAENTKSLSRRRALRSAIEPDLRENTLVKQRFGLAQACHEGGIHSTAEWCAGCAARCE